jgi:hypothetical protein
VIFSIIVECGSPYRTAPYFSRITRFYPIPAHFRIIGGMTVGIRISIGSIDGVTRVVCKKKAHHTHFFPHKFVLQCHTMRNVEEETGQYLSIYEK